MHKYGAIQIRCMNHEKGNSRRAEAFEMWVWQKDDL